MCQISVTMSSFIIPYGYSAVAGSVALGLCSIHDAMHQPFAISPAGRDAGTRSNCSGRDSGILVPFAMAATNRSTGVGNALSRRCGIVPKYREHSSSAAAYVRCSIQGEYSVASVLRMSDKVYRTRQIALLLSEQDRDTALAYAAELEWETNPPRLAPVPTPLAPPAERR